MFLSRKIAPTISKTPKISSTKLGKPGISIITITTIPAIRSTNGCAVNWDLMSLMRLSSEAARVTIIPVATEISSDGICEHKPSPTVARE